MKKRFDNPFVTTTGYAGPEYFCDRQKETEDLIRLLRNGNNIALVEKGLVTSERGEYQVYDKFFQIWMETV